jgi:NAD(P)-dependent dehydrogenase (short-subunit alcohol dehydrogenase family)
MTNAYPKLYDGRVVLVTGGTMGIGLATALAFARHGARLVLTYKWGSADEKNIRHQFSCLQAPEPLIIEADIARGEDTKSLFASIKEQCGRLDTFISNASAAVTIHSMEDYTERAFLKTMRSTAWPTVEYTLAAKDHLGHYPRYVVVMSSDGPDRFTPAYDLVACSKAAIETLARYLAYRLREDDVRVNVLRSRAIKTDGLADTFGADFYSFLRHLVPDAWFMSVEEVANAAFGLCSGMFDGMTGQVLMVDRGNTFADGISVLYERREALGL